MDLSRCDAAQKSYELFFSKDERINSVGVKKLIAIEQQASGLKRTCCGGDRKLVVDEVHRELVVPYKKGNV